MQMSKTDTDKLFRYAFTFIDAHWVDVRASGGLTRGERMKIEQLAGGKLTGGEKGRMLQFLADNPAALRYLAALLKSDECQ
jgi:hypothetical protein